MFKKIVIPLDGSPEATAIMPIALAFARARYAELVLVRVTTAYPDDDPVNVEARQQLADVVRAYHLDDVRVRTELRYGDAGEQILEAARLAGADLIAIATHGRHGLSRAWYGSVAEQVLAASAVPLLLLRADGKSSTKLRTVLVPVDNSPGSVAALEQAHALAALTHARLVLLEVVAPQRERGVAATGIAVAGPVAESIGRIARERDADLIVMGTHGLIGPRRAVLGSIADAVVRTSGLPVLLIRQAGAGEMVGEERVAGDVPVR